MTIPPAATSPPSPVLSELDLRGLRCPLPVLRTRKALAAMPRGGTVRVFCTDPLAGVDIPHLVRETGNVLLLSEDRDGGSRIFTILKA